MILVIKPSMFNDAFVGYIAAGRIISLAHALTVSNHDATLQAVRLRRRRAVRGASTD
jgi:hypothetical protein